MSVLATIVNQLFIGTAYAQGEIAHVEQVEDHGSETIELVLAAALLVLLVILAVKARKMMLGVLDKRTDRIREDLAEAARLRSEAEAYLAKAQAREREAVAEAAAIIERAKHDAQRHREKAAVDVEEAMKRREAMALQRIVQAEAQAVAEVRAGAATVAVAAARDLIGRQLAADPSRGSALIDGAIAELGGKLH